MRTTINLPDDLLEEAMKVSGARTKKETVCLALQELISKNRMLKIIEYGGKIALDLNTSKIRKERELR